MTVPDVSVVMSVYNGERYLNAAIDSILAQTLTGFEFIIIDDGSTDATAAIIDTYHDERIRVVRRDNKGLVASLNEGIELAKSPLVARMDADDLSEPMRLATQVAYLSDHPETVMVGCNLTFIDEDGRPTLESPLLLGDDELKLELIVRNPFGHGAVMYRREAVRGVGGYRKEAWPAEDYDLWARLAPSGDFANIDSVLYWYRLNDAGISAQNEVAQRQRTDAIRNGLWAQFQTNTVPSYGRLAKRYDASTVTGRLQRGRLRDCYALAIGAARRRHRTSAWLTLSWRLIGSSSGLVAAAKYLLRPRSH